MLSLVLTDDVSKGQECSPFDPCAFVCVFLSVCMDFGVFLLSYIAGENHILQFSYLITEDFVKHFRITEISDSKS